MSTFTPNKNLEEPANGSYVDDWNIPVNANWTAIDNSLGGTATISVTGQGPGTGTLSLAQYQPPNIEFTGVSTGNIIYYLPSGIGGVWTILNATTGAYTLGFGVTGSNSITIPQGQRAQIVSDGTVVALTQTPPTVTAPTFAITAGESAAGVTLSTPGLNLTYLPGNAWRYGADPTGATDTTLALQLGINAAWSSKIDFYIPGGLYLITATLIINQFDQVNYRGEAFRIYGNGAGPVFVPTPPVTTSTTAYGTTVITCNTDCVLMRYKQWLGADTSSGNYYLQYVRFQQTNTAATNPVVQFDVFGEYSKFSNFEIYQAGINHGLFLIEGTKGVIEEGNILNRDWLTPPVTRVGTGIAVGDQYQAGLLTIRKVTSRGFLNAFTVGSGANPEFCTGFYDCEVSNVTNGWKIYPGIANTLIDHCYNDGGLTGTVVIDDGTATVVRNCLFNAGFSVGIDGTNAGYGWVYQGNTIGVTGPGSTAMILVSTGAYGGPGGTCRDNYLAYSTPGNANVIGIQISGIDPRIDGLSSNIFNPRGPWTGSGSMKVDDLSTSSTGSAGTGVYGVAKAIDGNYEYPLLSRGAISFGRNTTALSNTAVSGATLNLGQASLYEVVPTASVSSIALINASAAVEGMLYILHFAPTAFTWTFTAGTNMLLPGSANLTTTTSGGIYTFQMDKGVARLLCAPVTY